MKKRVLHFYSVMNIGGAETFAMNVFRNIDKSKYSFDFACSSNRRGFYDDEIIKLGGKIFHFKTSKNPFLTISRIQKIIRDNGPYDCIHSTSMFFSSLICIAAKLEGIKNIIVHSHSAGDSYSKSFVRNLYVKSSRFIINKLANYKLSCGIDAANFLFGNTNDVLILRNGIDCNKFANVKQSDVKKKKKDLNIKDEIIIGEVARFSIVKNQQYFITLAKYLNRNNINYKIVLVGDGEEKENIMNMVRTNKLNDNFIFIPATNDVSVYMKMFDIFIMPSLYEGLPMTIIEALSAGTHCIISNSITNEFKIFGDYVKYFDLNENIDLESIKKKIIDDKEDKKILNIIYNNRYDINATINDLEKIYNNEKVNS